MYSKLKKISKKSGEPKKKSQRKRRTLRKRKIKRKSLKFGGALLNVDSIKTINSHLGNNEKNELKKKSGFWLEGVPPFGKKFLKYVNSNGSNFLYLKDSYDAPKEINRSKTINVLWVRHCESCANVALEPKMLVKTFNPFETWKQKMFREPLCTLTDKEKMLKLGRNLSNIDPPNIKFFSSFLARAMETAKIISIGFSDQKEAVAKKKDEAVPVEGKGAVVETDNLIKRIPFVSEEIKFYDKVRGEKTSQSTTTAEKSLDYATFLNKNLRGYDIDIDREDTQDLYGDKASNMGEYYNKFLKEYILKDNDTLLEQTVEDESIKLNVIVSHGGYIRMNISEPQQILDSEEIPSTIKHPRNIECFLVEYTVDQYGQITCKKFPGFNDIFKGTVNLLKSKHPCELSYNDISNQPVN